MRHTDTDTDTITEVREKGLGKGFLVVSPSDGFRNDNRLWFGYCSACGEMVTNSTLRGVWEHTIYTQRFYRGRERFEQGVSYSSVSHNVDYCPTAQGETTVCEVIIN